MLLEPVALDALRMMYANPFLLPVVLFALMLGACGTNAPKTESGLTDTVPADESAITDLSDTEPNSAHLLSYPPLPDYAAPSLGGDYSGYSTTEAFIERLEKQGFDREFLYGVFSKVEREQWILDYLNRPSNKSTTPRPGGWTRYRKRFLTSQRIDKGLVFWHEHEANLERAYHLYGVPPEYVVAIIGVETNYGGYVGSHKVINALSTLAFDYPRRADFFTDELEAFLIMARNEGMDPFEPIGSYAGAMGLGQFMPSSFHRFAVDFDGDGHRDLWNEVDAIGSVASYFAGYGWRRGEPVAVQASAKGSVPHLMEAGFSSRYAPDALARQGVTATASLEGHPEVSLLRLHAAQGPEYWIGLHNFYVISRYNHSTYYAMAVHQLAQELKRRHDQVPHGPVMSFEPPVLPQQL